MGPVLLVVPALAVFVLFVIVPFCTTLSVAMHRWDGVTEATWAGWANYRRAFGDPVFGQAMLNNIGYWLITLVTEILAGLVLAALLVRIRRGKAFFRLTLSLPLMIALVASAVLWRQLLIKQGLINSILTGVGLVDEPIVWLAPGKIVLTVGLVSGWAYAGFFMLLFYAALERIPDELREAARVDGATDWRVFWGVELPLLKGVGGVAFLLCTTGAFRAFDLFYVMGGPLLNARSEVAATLVVKTATLEQRGYSAAISVIVVLAVVSVGSLLRYLTSRGREVEF
jgi:raffinose/stachyose/melibiose transport system permease protein